MHGNHRKIHVIHGGIDTEYFRPREAVDPAVQALRRDWGLAPDEFAFAVVGGYDGPRGKGQREFLVAAARVHPAAPKARFLIVGRGNMEDQLRADIRRLGLEQVARLVPYCHDIASAMNALDCLVHPQVGTEAFGLVLLEGFACGKPVIASELDGIPEAFAAGQLGQLVPPENIEALAAAMLRWSHTPPLAFGERSQLHARVARDFSIARYAERVRRLYEQLA
jgi:glycosyltransferase involved in cell wall biosynthesis